MPCKDTPEDTIEVVLSTTDRADTSTTDGLPPPQNDSPEKKGPKGSPRMMPRLQPDTRRVAIEGPKETTEVVGATAQGCETDTTTDPASVVQSSTGPRNVTPVEAPLPDVQASKKGGELQGDAPTETALPMETEAELRRKQKHLDEEARRVTRMERNVMQREKELATQALEHKMSVAYKKRLGAKDNR